MDWSSLPNWLTEIFRQFPVVVLCGFALWRTAKYLDARHHAELQTHLARHDAAVKLVRELTV